MVQFVPCVRQSLLLGLVASNAGLGHATAARPGELQQVRFSSLPSPVGDTCGALRSLVEGYGFVVVRACGLASDSSALVRVRASQGLCDHHTDTVCY